MDFFDKATKVAKDVGNSVKTTAVNVGNSISNITKEQSELAGLKLQKSNIDKKLNSAYAEIGRKYVEYIQQCDTGILFDVSDIVEEMKPDLEKIAELDAQIADRIIWTGKEKRRRIFLIPSRKSWIKRLIWKS
jgi:hypothetical protein